jgi:hypothetical protein
MDWSEVRDTGFLVKLEIKGKEQNVLCGPITTAALMIQHGVDNVKVVAIQRVATEQFNRYRRVRDEFDPHRDADSPFFGNEGDR